MTILFAATGFASRTAAQADVWRDSQEFEARRAALNRVSENRDTAPRYRRQLASASHLVDIKRLRAINVELQPAASQSGPLDFKFLAKSAAEINKLARRLQTDLQETVEFHSLRRNAPWEALPEKYFCFSYSHLALAG